MKKGFTIVELLATIIILGIIGTIGIVIFDNIIHNMRLKAYNTQKENFILSAERWLNEKKGTDQFPTNMPYKLTLEVLLNEFYIDKDICNQEDRLKINYKDSYVEIIEDGLVYKYELKIVNTEDECK